MLCPPRLRHFISSCVRRGASEPVISSNIVCCLRTQIPISFASIATLGGQRGSQRGWGGEKRKKNPHNNVPETLEIIGAQTKLLNDAMAESEHLPASVFNALVDLHNDHHEDFKKFLGAFGQGSIGDDTDNEAQQAARQLTQSLSECMNHVVKGYRQDMLDYVKHIFGSMFSVEGVAKMRADLKEHEKADEFLDDPFPISAVDLLRRSISLLRQSVGENKFLLACTKKMGVVIRLQSAWTKFAGDNDIASIIENFGELFSKSHELHDSVQTSEFGEELVSFYTDFCSAADLDVAISSFVVEMLAAGNETKDTTFQACQIHMARLPAAVQQHVSTTMVLDELRTEAERLAKNPGAMSLLEVSTLISKVWDVKNTGGPLLTLREKHLDEDLAQFEKAWEKDLRDQITMCKGVSVAQDFLTKYTMIEKAMDEWSQRCAD